MTTAEAFEHCRRIARREAKNFFWSFRVLPRPKRDAMCAVYAFMRKADDLADDERLSITERREVMAEWTERWRRSCAEGDGDDDPVFVAMHAVQRRYGVPGELLEELLRGATLDLDRSRQGSAAEPQTYATFEDLYAYCYLVASVVGLVTIRIFGYTDPRAEKLAEETGVAFQLTNILRDVKEDAERGRVYLPLDLLTEDGVTVERIGALAGGSPLRENERAALATLAIRAERLYVSGRQLLPMIDRDSRAALWVLIEIYHRLLTRIGARRMEVFRGRVSVPTSQKLLVLARGAVMALRYRIAR